MAKKIFLIKTKWWFGIIPILFSILLGYYLINSFNQKIEKTYPESKISYQSSHAEASSSAKPTATPAASIKPVVNLPPKISGSFGVPILTYHFVANNPNPQDIARDSLEVTPDKFEAQMDYLSSHGYTPISLDTLFAIFSKQTSAPAKPIVLTFDDGYIDFYTTVYPILTRFNFHAVSFIPTGLIGTSYYMNWGQIREIAQSGLVTFEDHTVSHANLAGLSYDQALKQMTDSKNELQSQTGYPVNFIAYPYGISNSLVQQAATVAGFVGGVGTWYGKADGIYMNMPRIKVSGYWAIEEFASRI